MNELNKQILVDELDKVIWKLAEASDLCATINVDSLDFLFKDHKQECKRQVLKANTEILRTMNRLRKFRNENNLITLRVSN